MPESRKLLIVGDSISLGVAELRVSEIVGYVSPVYTDILRSEMPNVDIHVDADIHRTTGNALAIVDSLLEHHRPEVALIMLGGNDVDVEWRRFVISSGRIVRNRVPVETYAENLEAIARKTHAAGVWPVLTDMPNHFLAVRGPYLSALSGKDVAAMIAATGGQEHSDAGLQVYREAAAQVAGRVGCSFVDYGQTLHEQPLAAMSGTDGVHPSARAHQIIAARLVPVLRELLAPGRVPLRRMPA